MPPTRIRNYPYKVTYIYPVDGTAGIRGFKVPVFTEVVKTLNAAAAKAIVKAKVDRPLIFLNAQRYPENLGKRGITGPQNCILTARQQKLVREELDILVKSPVGTPRPVVLQPSKPSVIPPFTVNIPMPAGVQPPKDLLSVGGFSVGDGSFRGLAPAPTPVAVGVDLSSSSDVVVASDPVEIDSAVEDVMQHLDPLPEPEVTSGPFTYVNTNVPEIVTTIGPVTMSTAIVIPTDAIKPVPTLATNDAAAYSQATNELSQSVISSSRVPYKKLDSDPVLFIPRNPPRKPWKRYVLPAATAVAVGLLYLITRLK